MAVSNSHLQHHIRRIIIALVFVLLIGGASLYQSDSSGAQSSEKPFRLPFNLSPGPNTWLIGQFYGNTTDAYNFHEKWYEAGQRLHFGLDFYAPCGTPIVAIGDGTVHTTDAPSFGAGPHNVIIRHDDVGVVTLYGHLLNNPLVFDDQPIKAGDILGYVGDSQGECGVRPHLHLEVRSTDYRTTYNPVNYIEAPWHVLASIGPLTQPQFQQDMNNPNRWTSVDDQPPITFGGAPLNNYNRAWPLLIESRAPQNAATYRLLPPPSDTWEQTSLGFGGCCTYPWWDAADSNLLRVIDGVPEQRADVFEWDIASGERYPIGDTPPTLESPDGTHQIYRSNGGIEIYNELTDTRWMVDTEGALPAINADNTMLLWNVYEANIVPRESYPIVRTFVSNIDGSDPRQIAEQEAGWTMWLDAARVLIVTPTYTGTTTTMTVYDTRNGSHFVLGAYDWMREITVSPGGGHVMFYVMWQSNPAASGVYALETIEGAVPQKMPWFGAWRWRDAESVYFIPFDTAWINNGAMTLAYYNIVSGDGAFLTNPNALPFTIANGDWAVSPDGTRIAFRNAADLNTWLLESVGN